MRLAIDTVADHMQVRTDVHINDESMRLYDGLRMGLTGPDLAKS